MRIVVVHRLNRSEKGRRRIDILLNESFTNRILSNTDPTISQNKMSYK